MMPISPFNSIKHGVALDSINFRCLLLVIVHPGSCMQVQALNTEQGSVTTLYRGKTIRFQCGSELVSRRWEESWPFLVSSLYEHSCMLL